jgi:hypothetical protein
MAHPCRTGNPGTTLHACDTEQSPKTMCGKVLHRPTVGTVWGFKAVCLVCYPQKKEPGNAAMGEPKTQKIAGREHWPDHVE